MVERHSDAVPGDGSREHRASSGPLAGNKRKRSRSMHDGIAVWCDCCSCAAEPYWLEVAEEMGIDLGSDYEDDESLVKD